VALPSTGKQHTEQQIKSSFAIFDPCTGQSSGTQGRAEVGELFVDAAMSVEQLIQPQDAAAAAIAADMPVRALLEALEAQGQVLYPPRPLAKASAVLEACTAGSSHSTNTQLDEHAPAYGSFSGVAAAAAAASFELAVSLVAAVWKLWQLGTLADTAAAYQAAVAAAAAAAPSANTGTAAAAAAAAKDVSVHQRMCMRTTADNTTSLSQECSWMLPAVHAGSELSQASQDSSRLLQLQQHIGSELYSGKEGGQRSTTACVLVGSSSACSSSCTSMTGSEVLVSSDGTGEPLYMSRYQHRQQQQQQQHQQASRLQQSKPVAATDVLCGLSSSSRVSPAWEQVMQLQRQAEVLQLRGKQAQNGPSPIAEAVLQLLSLKRLLAAGILSPAAASEDTSSRSSSAPLPGMYYLHLLSDAAVIGGLR
jgi:hypothetical protein